MDPFDGVGKQIVNGVELAFVERGEGTPLVLVHGSVSDLRTWHAQLPMLAGSHRTIAYSRRYARPNLDIGEGVDDQMMPHVDDLIAFLEARGLGKASLLGHSWGGMIVLLAAMRRPDLVERIVLEEPPVMSMFIDIPPKPSQIFKLLVSDPGLAGSIIKFATGTAGPAQALYNKGEDEAAMKLFGRGIFGSAAFEAIPVARMRQALDNVKADKAQVTGAAFPSLNRKEVGVLQTPALLLHGRNSPALFRRMTMRLESILPNARRLEVPNASHLVHEDNPEFVNRAVLEFLSS